jgi:hypothetical protein
LSSKLVDFPPDHTYNREGRGYPDISTYGSNFFVFLDGEISRESGTSASSPVFGAMVTLWNDMRLAYGMPPLGFIAPFLYHVYEFSPEAFNDVVYGDNACGVGGSIETANCCDYGFSAVPGWDAVTGLGSPNFQILANLVVNNGSYFPNSNDNANGAVLGGVKGVSPASVTPTSAPTNKESSKDSSVDKKDEESIIAKILNDDERTGRVLVHTARVAAAAFLVALTALLLAIFGLVMSYRGGTILRGMHILEYVYIYTYKYL